MDNNVDVVDLINENCPIDKIMERDGFHLHGSHGRLQICVEHDSLKVDLDKGWYYWNSEKEGGDRIKWVMLRRGLDFKGACEEICRQFGLPSPVWGKIDIQAREIQQTREEVLEVAMGVFTRWLWASPAALDYCRKNRCWTDETIRLARLGFSGSGSGAERKEMTDAMIEAGIDVKSPAAVSILGLHPYGADKVDVVSRWLQDNGIKAPSNWLDGGYVPGMMGRERIVYPYVENGHVATDQKTKEREPRGGKIVYMSGRGIEDKPILDEAGNPSYDSNFKLRVDRGIFALPEPLAGPQPLYYNFAYNRRVDQVVIVEGQADAVTLGQWGYGGVSIGNISARNELKTDGLKRMANKDKETHKAIYIGLDADTGGNTGRWGIADQIGPMARMLSWPTEAYPTYVGVDGKEHDTKDANDILRATTQGGVEGVEQSALVYARMTGATAYVEERCAAAGQAEGAENDDAVQAVLPLIARMDKTVYAKYKASLARLLKINKSELDGMLKSNSTSKKDKDEGQPVFTYGEHLKSSGWLLEYMYDPEAEYARIAWRDPDGKIGSGDSVTIEGQVYKPFPPNETIKASAVLFPSKIGEECSLDSLITKVEIFIRSVYLLQSDKVARLIAYWVLLTWLYDCFETTIYLRAMGDAGSGKSEMMKRIGLMCYRMMSVSGADTPALLFRILQKYKGTIFMDEADLDYSDPANPIVKIYNLGAMKMGSTIWRTEEVIGPDGGKRYEEAGFSTFGPKLIAMRKDFKDDAVGSRSLTFHIQPREIIELVDAGIPLSITEDMKAQALAIRNLLLRWRLEKWQPEIKVDPSYYEMTISARLNQVAGPLLALAANDQMQQDEIRKTLREYYAETILGKSMTIQARIIEACWKIWQDKSLHDKMVRVENDGTFWIKIGDITAVANQIVLEMNGGVVDEDDDDKKGKSHKDMTTQGVGRRIREDLQLTVRKVSRYGYFAQFALPRMKGLSMRYGVNPDDFKPAEGKPEFSQPSLAGGEDDL